MKIATFLILAAVVPNINSKLFVVLSNIIKNKAEDILDTAAGNTRCARDLKIFLKDLIHLKLWALEMLDASGKVSSGMLMGNLNIMGNFDQCMLIHEEKNTSVINGQYCTVVLKPSSKYKTGMTDLLDIVAGTNFLGIHLGSQTEQVLNLIKMTYGLCIPASCSIGNLQEIWNYVENTFRIPLHVSFVDILCRSKDKPVEPYAFDYYVFVAFAVYAVFLLVSTLYDVLIHQHGEGNGNKDNNYFVAFSLYSNAKKLFAFNPQDGIGLKCLSGMKVISMLWITLGHKIVGNMFSANINSRDGFQWWKNYGSTPFMAASFAVDTFFALSGLLLSYVFLQNQHLMKAHGMPIVLFYLYRLLRLIPGLSAAVLFYVSIFKNLSDGPAWPIITTKLTGSCRETWWATLSFVSNMLPMQYQCLEQSWFLAVDSQLYLISPLILKKLIKSPRKAVLICIAACVVSAIYTYVITKENKYGAIYYEGDKAFYQHIYLPTFVRMPPWIIGLIMGYFIFAYKQISIPKILNVLLWSFSLGTMLFLTLIHVEFARNSYDAVRSAIFNSCAKQAWALAVSIIAFLCVTGNGGIIDRFLSLPIFQILVRLAYSIYLVHIGVLLYFLGGTKTVGYFSNFNSVHGFIGDSVFIFLVGVVWCLAFETPFYTIGKIAMQRGIAELEKKKAITQNKSTFKKKNKKNYIVCVYNYKDMKQKKFE